MNFIDANNHLNIDLFFEQLQVVTLKNFFSDLTLQSFDKFFREFFDVRDGMEYKFETGGYSGCLILGESHINWHSFPEDNLLKIDIYSCKDIENKVDNVLEGLYNLMNASYINYSFTKGSKNNVRYQPR